LRRIQLDISGNSGVPTISWTLFTRRCCKMQAAGGANQRLRETFAERNVLR
jgi:hypothetical protein